MKISYGKQHEHLVLSPLPNGCVQNLKNLLQRVSKKRTMRTNLILLAASFLASGALAQEEVYEFESETITHPEGKASQSENFVFTLTGDGTTDNCEWTVKEDSSAPSGKKVLAIVSGDAIDTCWPIGFLRNKQYQDCVVSAQFKIVGGNVNQAGGLIFHARDADHSYLLRASAKDASLVLMRVNKKERTKLGSGKIAIAPNRWYNIKVVCKGTEIECHFNGAKVFSAKDAVYPVGKVGVISQADSVTHFDDFKVMVPSQ